jgi:hypothetical protein
MHVSPIVHGSPSSHTLPVGQHTSPQFASVVVMSAKFTTPSQFESPGQGHPGPTPSTAVPFTPAAGKGAGAPPCDSSTLETTTVPHTHNVATNERRSML